MTFELDEVSFQRLADGEMRNDERRQLLRRLDGEPDQWRRLALAFVEQQIWNEALHAEGASTGKSVAVQARHIPHRPRRQPFSSWLTAAVVILLVFTGGYFVGNSVPAAPSRSSIADSFSNRAPVVGDANPTLTLEEAIARSPVDVPDGFRLSLLRCGYYLDEVHTTRPVKLPTGDEVELPIREVNVRFLGNAAFQ